MEDSRWTTLDLACVGDPSEDFCGRKRGVGFVEGARTHTVRIAQLDCVPKSGMESQEAEMLTWFTLFACGGSPAAPAPAAVLKAADAHDGAEDHVVSECVGCGLGMKGSAAHTVEHEGYALQFCSESCAMRFEADPEASLAPIRKKLGVK